MEQSLTILNKEENRRNLLLAEAVGWLHDFRKCTDEHIKRQAFGNDPSRIPYSRDYLQAVESYQVKLLGGAASFKELIRGKDREGSWLVRILAYCHDQAHVEKENVFFHEIKQLEANTRSSSSFGCEFGPLRGLSDRLYHIPFEHIEYIDQTEKRSEFRDALVRAFKNVPADTERPINEVTLWDWSVIVAALYKAALAASILHDKQEDTSEMHWRLLGVRLNGADFTDRAARIPDLLVRQKLIMDGLDRVRQLLEETYPVGTEIYRDENGSVFIVPCIDELLTLKNAQGASLRDLIKQEFSAGTIYDEKDQEIKRLCLDGEVVPWIEFNPKESWQRTESYRHQAPLPIAQHVTEPPISPTDPERMKQWWKGDREDICTVCQVRPQGWGDHTYHTSHQARGEKYNRACQTCKSLERRVCGICEQRREDRSKEWATGKLNTTIWIDEVADVNGRVTLVVGKFDLAPWLDGEMLFYPAELTALKVRWLNTVPTEGQAFLIKGKEYIWDGVRGAIVSISEIKEDLIPAQGKMFRVKQQETPRQEAITLVEETDTGSAFLEVEGSFKVHSMIETQTPARLHRVWETTRTFWEETAHDFRRSVGEVQPRLRIYTQEMLTSEDRRGEIRLDSVLGRFHTYELKLGNVNLSVVHVGGGEFFSVDNLQRIAKLLQPSQKLADYTRVAQDVFYRLVEENKHSGGIQIEQPTGYGNPNKPIGWLHLREGLRLEDTLEQTAYIPAIAIFTEPQTFMAIVPADKALRVARCIKRKYEAEMGKVCNRLSLTVGLVFAGQRTPLPAILDAGRRMLKQPTKDEKWIVKENRSVIETTIPSKEVQPDRVVLSLKKVQEPDSSELDAFSVETSIMAGGRTTGDGTYHGLPVLPCTSTTIATINEQTVMDVWYPYWQVVGDANGSALTDREMQFKGIHDDEIWIHALKLQAGDKVSLMPSRFDFEFLDTASQRFEVSYNDDQGKRRGFTHASRPYYLEDLDRLAWLWTILSAPTGLTTSQIHNLIGLIEAKRIEWAVYKDQPAFEQTVRDALDNAGWEIHPRKRLDNQQFKRFCQAAIDGQLTDVVELYMRILKEKPARDELEVSDDNN